MTMYVIMNGDKVVGWTTTEEFAEKVLGEGETLHTLTEC